MEWKCNSTHSHYMAISCQLHDLTALSPRKESQYWQNETVNSRDKPVSKTKSSCPLRESNDGSTAATTQTALYINTACVGNIERFLLILNQMAGRHQWWVFAKWLNALMRYAQVRQLFTWNSTLSIIIKSGIRKWVTLINSRRTVSRTNGAHSNFT